MHGPGWPLSHFAGDSFRAQEPFGSQPLVRYDMGNHVLPVFDVEDADIHCDIEV